MYSRQSCSRIWARDFLLARGGRREKRTKEEKERKAFLSFQRRLFSSSVSPKLHPSISTSTSPPRGEKTQTNVPSDAHGEAKVAYPWLAPTDPAKWKEEHTVFVVLGGWAIAISSAMKIFGGGGKKGDEAPAAVVAAPAK